MFPEMLYVSDDVRDVIESEMNHATSCVNAEEWAIQSGLRIVTPIELSHSFFEFDASLELEEISMVDVVRDTIVRR